jgi:hypothetical protein
MSEWLGRRLVNDWGEGLQCLPVAELTTYAEHTRPEREEGRTTEGAAGAGMLPGLASSMGGSGGPHLQRNGPRLRLNGGGRGIPGVAQLRSGERARARVRWAMLQRRAAKASWSRLWRESVDATLARRSWESVLRWRAGESVAHRSAPQLTTRLTSAGKGPSEKACGGRTTRGLAPQGAGTLVYHGTPRRTVPYKCLAYDTTRVPYVRTWMGSGQSLGVTRMLCRARYSAGPSRSPPCGRLPAAESSAKPAAPPAAPGRCGEGVAWPGRLGWRPGGASDGAVMARAWALYSRTRPGRCNRNPYAARVWGERLCCAAAERGQAARLWSVAVAGSAAAAALAWQPLARRGLPHGGSLGLFRKLNTPSSSRPVTHSVSSPPPAAATAELEPPAAAPCTASDGQGRQ